MNTFTHSQSAAPHSRTGFTLTEMLVATALVVLIMLLFAQIYGSAIGTMTDQRGLANNDQKARVLTSVLRGDLQKMTFRQPSSPYGQVRGLVPIVAGDEPIIDPVNQRGYFFYAENDTDDDTDDILQFTTDIRVPLRKNSVGTGFDLPYVGKAQNRTLGAGFHNYCELDDGIEDNGLGQSRAAEISYFLRNGTLYRRVLLLRDPLNPVGPFPSQPSNSSGTLIYRPEGTTNYSGEFNDNFDYSATRWNSALWFHSVDSLSNHLGLTNVPIAIPNLRFGFNPSTGASLVNASDGNFIGRFTHEETSHNDFDYPGSVPSNHPYTRTDLTVNNNGVVTQYSGGNRRGEDILLTNVDAFDIKLAFEGTIDATDVSTGFDSWHPNASGTAPSYTAPTVNDQLKVQSASTRTYTSGSTDNFIQIPALNGSISMLYRRVGGGSGINRQPEFPPSLGTVVENNNSRWVCVENRNGVTGITIQVRYRDVQTNQPRQVTIVHSFVE